MCQVGLPSRIDRASLRMSICTEPRRGQHTDAPAIPAAAPERAMLLPQLDRLPGRLGV
jgi:hypothetical protein